MENEAEIKLQPINFYLPDSKIEEYQNPKKPSSQNVEYYWEKSNQPFAFTEIPHFLQFHTIIILRI